MEQTDTTNAPPPVRDGRGDRSFLNYAIVLLVFCAAVAAIVLLVSARQEENIRTVEYLPDALALSDEAPFPAHVPENLPEGWLPTSSRVDLGAPGPDGATDDPVSWDVGFATPEDQYASLRIGDADPGDFVAEHTEDGQPVGEDEEVDGEVWQRYANDEGRLSLVREIDGATLVVTGTADYAELAVLAGSLEVWEPRDADDDG